MRYFYKPDGSRHSAIRGIGPSGFASVYHRDPVQRLSILVNDLAGTASDMSVSLAYNPAGQIRSYHRDNDAYAWTGGTSINRDYTVKRPEAAGAAPGLAGRCPPARSRPELRIHPITLWDVAGCAAPW